MSPYRVLPWLLVALVTLAFPGVLGIQAAPTSQSDGDIPDRLTSIEVSLATLVASNAALSTRVSVLETVVAASPKLTPTTTMTTTATPKQLLLPTPTPAQSDASLQTATFELDETALSSLRVEEDRMLGTRRYYDDAFPRNELNPSVEDDEIYLYIEVADGKATLRFRTLYIGSDWLFIDRMIFKAGDRLDEVSLPTEPRREVIPGGTGAQIAEEIDIEINASLLNTIQDIVTSDISLLRVQGEDYYADLFVTWAMQQSMQNVLGAYEAATGIDVLPLPNELSQPQSTEYLQESIVGRWSLTSFFGDDEINEFLADGTWIVEDERFVSGRYYFPERGQIYMGKISKRISDPDKREAVNFTRNVVIVDDIMYMTYDWMERFFEYKRID